MSNANWNMKSFCHLKLLNITSTGVPCWSRRNLPKPQISRRRFIKLCRNYTSHIDTDLCSAFRTFEIWFHFSNPLNERWQTAVFVASPEKQERWQAGGQAGNLCSLMVWWQCCDLETHIPQLQLSSARWRECGSDQWELCFLGEHGNLYFFRHEISQLQICKTLYWPNNRSTLL